jgi:hypothetical protein
VAEEAESLVKKYFEVVAGFPPEVVAVAVLWTAAKAAGVPRPLEDFLKCSRAEERRVRRVAWRLKEEARLGRRPIEDYVKTLAARVNLPASIVKAAVELLEKNRRVLFGKNPWVSAAAALWLASLKRLGLLKALAEAAGTTTVEHKESRREDEGMKVWKIRQYLPALLLYIQRRVGGERGFLVAVRTRDVCGVDRRCGRAVHSLMMRLVEKGLARRFKKGHIPNREEGGGGGLDGLEGVDMTTAKKIKTTAAVFELPQKLGILQYVEYEPPPREWCTNDGCLYEGLLTAEGCRRGVCVKYRVWVHSKDRRRWEAKERWRRRRDEDVGGCIRQQVADALWELSGTV